MRPFDVLVVSHGDLASAMVASASMICGETPGVRAVSLVPTDSPETFAGRLLASIDDERPTLILSDLCGGTPGNVVLSVTRDRPGVRSICGANLGLLMEAMTADGELDDAFVERLVTLAREGVMDVTSRVRPSG